MLANQERRWPWVSISQAYQLLTSKGNIQKDNIITMMYDDIAYNDENPYPGNIINYPNGTNVYENVTIDYSGEDVTASNFLNVLNDLSIHHPFTLTCRNLRMC